MPRTPRVRSASARKFVARVESLDSRQLLSVSPASVVVPATLFGPSSIAPLATPTQFDFGSPNSPVAPGYTAVTAASTYSASAGFGWTAGQAAIRAQDDYTSNPLTRDYDYAATGITFAVGVANGTYDVAVTSGSAGVARGPESVTVEGAQVGTISSAAGQYTTGTYRVSVSDGQLTLALKYSGSGYGASTINALVVTPVGGGGGGGGGGSGTPAPAPYSPAQIRHAYGFDQLSQTGAGQTIAIVDAYDDPTIAADLITFDQHFGLPAANFIKATPQGTPAYNAGWSTEIALDVEWAHAIAPGATILLVEAKSNSFNDLMAAVDYAVAQGAEQVSMSWGGTDFAGESGYDAHFNHPGVSFFASAGDSGAEAEYPAASPYVTAVGGTKISIDTNGNRISETAWTGSGGAATTHESKPGYQNGIYTGSGRGIPDVSYNADPSSGVLIYNSSSGTGSWGQVGGTSAGAPQWAGLMALVNEGRADLGKSSLGTGTTYGTNQVLYALAGGSSYTNAGGDFYDVTAGSNGNPAKSGYDLVTGLGSPVANKLVPDLVNA